MAAPKLSKDKLQQAVDLVQQHGTPTEAAVALGVPRATFVSRHKEAKRLGFKAKKSIKAPAKELEVVDVQEALRNRLLRRPLSMAEMRAATEAPERRIMAELKAMQASGVNVEREGDLWRIGKTVELASTSGKKVVEIVSRRDNTFLFGASGDQHIGSRYHREDVLRDLYGKYERHEVQAVFNTGNWIDGEASFNRYDLHTHGMDAQIELMAELFPKIDAPTYAVWGDDHEGWYVQREGVNVGWYAEMKMRQAGHDWHDLGYMEANVRLVNANTGKTAIMSVVHPGGGSSYATSYRPQKIIESLEGGEKPAVLLLGHYHKLQSGMTRNVWYLQTGTCQDQSPFMRKKSLEAHVGGAMIKLEQDPKTGAMTGFTPSLWPYFNRAYYVADGLANNRWSKHGAVSAIPRGISP